MRAVPAIQYRNNFYARPSSMKAWVSVIPILLLPFFLASSSLSMQWVQTFAGAAGHSFATQIGSLQFRHRCRSDGTLGLGMSAIR
jgi:hypothetical protein